ncbi:hypothetical protein [Rhodopirellula europaea]|uniref:hypothetical protein n=1 Tax=Rhodopirellula europaea TaxID=1263866 RepID=UPI003D296C76
MAIFVSLSAFHQTSFADPWQARDSIVWGGASFSLPQLPLEPELFRIEQESGEVIFSGGGSGNHRGYVGTWLVSRGNLFLWKMPGVPVKSREKLLDALDCEKFPIPATWFTGKLQLPVGDFDESSQTWPLVIELRIKDGVIFKTLTKKNEPERFIDEKKSNGPEKSKGKIKVSGTKKAG